MDTARTVVFETNHPYVTARDADGEQMDGKTFIHTIERMIHRYHHRWGIENGFKKQKAHHGSDDLNLLVKLALDDDHRSWEGENL